MATLLFLGSGSAFTVGADNFQSNILLTSDRGHQLLIDCGADIRWSLHHAGYSFQDITDIYVSHLHSDHAGGLEFIGFSRKFHPACHRPHLYLHEAIAREVWDRTLSGGMRCLHQEVGTLDTFFDVKAIASGGHFVWDDIEFQLIQVIHVQNQVHCMSAHGLFFELNGIKVFFTSDTQLCLEQNRKFYETADVIFHDCETSAFPSPVHAHYQELVALPEYLRHKMWLYGYQPGVLPDAEQAGFLGFVKRGQMFQFPAVEEALERSLHPVFTVAE